MPERAAQGYPTMTELFISLLAVAIVLSPRVIALLLERPGESSEA